MTRIFAIESGHYCGPSSIAAITGMPVKDAVRLINKRRGHGVGTTRRKDPKVRGTYWHEVVGELRKLGYVCTLIRLPSVPRPLRLIDMKEKLGWSSVHLIETKSHFMVMRDGLVVDNETPTGRELDKHPNRRMHVQRIWIVHSPKKG